MTWHKSHSILYVVGLMVFLTLVILEEMFGFLSYAGWVLSFLCGFCFHQREHFDEIREKEEEQL